MEVSFLDWENSSPSDHMQIGGVLVFESIAEGAAPSLAEVRARIRERLDLVPRLSQRLSSPRIGNFTRPRWERDPNFDVRDHVHAVDLEGGELLKWVGQYFSHRLDLSRPLWQVVLLDGLPNRSWALVSKIHHCLVDGIGGASVAVAMLLDFEQPRPAGDDHEADGSRSDSRSESDRMSRLWSSMGGGGLKPEKRRRRGRPIRERSPTREPTSLKVQISPNRTITAIDVPLDQLKAVKDRLGGTVNDVVLTAASSGLRHLFEHRGERPMPTHLRTMIPVNRRKPSELLLAGVRVSTLYIDLPLEAADPLARYRETVASSAVLKGSSDAARHAQLYDFAGAAPPLIQRWIERVLFRTFDLTITNVPGPRTQLYAMGAPMVRFVPVGPPLSSGYPLSISVFSYAGTVTFALLADPAAVPDLDILRNGVEESLADLDRLAHPAGR
jgi:diacylglycerol O-acyltransferase